MREEPGVDGAFTGGFGGEPVETARKDELIEDDHLLVEAALLRQIADAVETAAVEGLFKKADAAGVGHA